MRPAGHAGIMASLQVPATFPEAHRPARAVCFEAAPRKRSVLRRGGVPRLLGRGSASRRSRNRRRHCRRARLAKDDVLAGLERCRLKDRFRAPTKRPPARRLRSPFILDGSLLARIPRESSAGCDGDVKRKRRRRARSRSDGARDLPCFPKAVEQETWAMATFSHQRQIFAMIPHRRRAGLVKARGGNHPRRGRSQPSSCRLMWSQGWSACISTAGRLGRKESAYGGATG